MTLTHYHCTDMGYSLVTHFHYWIIYESLIIARFSSAEKASASVRDALYWNVYGTGQRMSFY